MKNRHQLYGRMIAFQMIQQLHKGLQEWYETPGFALPDDAWHLTSDYERVRNAVQNIRDSPCFKMKLPDIVCGDVPLRAVSEMTPRYNPAQNNIRNIIKQGVRIPEPVPNIYDPPDVYNPYLDPPDGHVDVLNIIENGVPFTPNRARRDSLITGEMVPGRLLSQAERKPVTSGLPPGQGWGLNAKSAPDNCDGSWDSFCGRSSGSDCLLSGHNDHRGGLVFHSLSGWLILNLEKVKHGVVIIRVEDWMGPNQVSHTDGWICENGSTDCPEATRNRDQEGGGRRTSDEVEQQQIRRELGNPNLCDKWTFEFAIDGNITKWDKVQWEEHRVQLQRVVGLWVLLDDSNYTGGEEKDVELAIRLTGCKRATAFGLSHIYWA